VAKMRVYELARDLGVDSKQVLDYLNSLGHDVKNHMSVLDSESIARVKGKFGAAQADAGEAKKQGAGQAPARQGGSAGSAARKGGSPSGEARSREREGERKQGGAQAKPRQAGGGGRQPAPEPGSKGKLELPETIAVRALAGKIGVQATAIVKYLFSQGKMVTVNDDLDFETAAAVAERFGYSVVRPEDPLAAILADEEDPPEKLQPIPPVVTIMGHVDHGKTTLLDAIRKTRVAQGEAGGITQHIGAYQVKWGGKAITFLDTPGHEAFTAMRSRGASVTHIAVLVVAADDGVMPQTIEAISHARAADVPIIVALNKIDKPEANPERVKQQLAEHGLIPEEWGGDTVVVPVSALKGQGISDLLEMILLVAELREIKANPDRKARGTVIEAKLDKGRGPVATVLVQKGTLRTGDVIVVGDTAGRVRAMLDDQGRPVDEATPSMPVEVLGLDDVPNAGDKLIAVDDERAARELAERLRQQAREQELQRQRKASLEDLFRQVQEGERKELSIVLKADVQGSVEALRDALLKLSNDDVEVRVVHAGVGGITKSDVDLAATTNAIIIGFNVRPDAMARRAAEQEHVEIRTYRVIYDVIDDVEKAMKGLLEPVYKEVVLGHAEVRALFKVPNVGIVAGAYVTDGRMVRGAKVRVIRNGVVVYDGELSSLRRFKDDVREVPEGFECGIGIAKFNDLKEGDVLEAYRMEAVAR